MPVKVWKKTREITASDGKQNIYFLSHLEEPKCDVWFFVTGKVELFRQTVEMGNWLGSDVIEVDEMTDRVEDGEK